jgi:hypothetical protein
MTPPDDPTSRRDEIGRKVAPGAASRGEFTYSVIEPAARQKAAASGERRGEGRTRSRLREGQVAERPGKILVECRIRDLSKRGARLQLDKDRPLPKAFLLNEAGTDRTYWAVLAWQVGRDAGVKLKLME